jgi:hypothetical protein
MVRAMSGSGLRIRGLIKSESVALGAAPPALLGGKTASSPLISPATMVTETTYEKAFHFLPYPGGIFLDPEIGLFEEFFVRSGPGVTSVSIATPFSDMVSVSVFDEMLGTFVDAGTLASLNEWFEFSAPTRRFRLTGLTGSMATVGLNFEALELVDLSWFSFFADEESSGGGGGGGGGGGEDLTAIPNPSSIFLLLSALAMVRFNRHRMLRVRIH